MKPVLLIILLFAFLPLFAQSIAISKFNKSTEKFEGSKIEQAEFLLRDVLVKGVVNSKNADIPMFLYQLLSDSIELPSSSEMQISLMNMAIDNSEIGGNIRDSISQNQNGTKARYFVIHDTSTPLFKDSIPNGINDSTWIHNDVEKIWKKAKLAHIFISRTGKSYSPINLFTPWRSTKFELKGLDEGISKGLFVHVELVQPRLQDTNYTFDNDFIAPNPGFTQAQYNRLALIYICASVRSRDWLVPAYHCVLDDGFEDGHDDPQNFELSSFSRAIENHMIKIQNNILTKKIIEQDSTIDLWATYYYVPHLEHSDSGIVLLDVKGNPTGIKLDTCDWCNAAIEGTIFVKKGVENYVLNYGSRSDSIQFDCRKCALYSNYSGYQKTGKVLWIESSGYGKGVNNYNLIPYKTIAVDSSLIPFGSVVFIPEAVGVQYMNENGEEIIHDGFFFTGDTGSMIIGNHIDVFTGDNSINPFTFVQSSSEKSFQVYFVFDEEIINELTILHTPPEL